MDETNQNNTNQTQSPQTVDDMLTEQRAKWTKDIEELATNAVKNSMIAAGYLGQYISENDKFLTHCSPS